MEHTQLLEAYRRVHVFLQAYEGKLPDILDARNWRPETRADVKALMSKLPKPEKATEADAVCIFEEIRTGNLEWSFPLEFEGERLGVFAARVRRESRVPLNEAILSCAKKPYWENTVLNDRQK